MCARAAATGPPGGADLNFKLASGRYIVWVVQELGAAELGVLTAWVEVLCVAVSKGRFEAQLENNRFGAGPARPVQNSNLAGSPNRCQMVLAPLSVCF